MIRSMCCRLQLDLRELLKRGNGLFGSAEQTGSLGVNHGQLRAPGLCLPWRRAGTADEAGRIAVHCRDSLEVKRKVIQRHMDAGLFPIPSVTSARCATIFNHWRTASMMMVQLHGRPRRHHHDSRLRTGGAPARSRARAHGRVQEETGHLYNLEATPAEARPTVCQGRPQALPGILQAGTDEAPYYQQLAVAGRFHRRPFEALERQDDLQRKYTGERYCICICRSRYRAVRPANAWSGGRSAISACLYHHHADILDLPDPLPGQQRILSQSAIRN